MSATINTHLGQATCTNYHWEADNETLAKYLNVLLDPNGPSGSDPNPDLTAARVAVNEIGAKIVDYDDLEAVPGRIY